MAAKAAHITATSHPKPSIFDIIAQDSLTGTLYPVIQKIIESLSLYNPSRYRKLIDYCDEIYLALNSALQYYYIKKYGASFAEHFYGLKRISAIRSSNHELTIREQKYSLIILVLLPYLKLKIDDKLAQYRLEIADGLILSNWKRKLKKILCASQGILHLSYTFWTISIYLKYMSGRTDYQNPALRILNLKLTYIDIEEENIGFFRALFRGNLSFSQLSFGLLGQAVQNSLEFAAFFVQFLRSWQSEKSNINITALPAPDPPQYDPNSKTYKGKCPLCMQHWKIPTVISISGYIYCYRCIVKHLQEANFCPVTKLPASMADIVRFYEN